MSAVAAPVAHDWAYLVRPDQVHGSVYADPAIFEAELQRIWYRTWVYVGHVSEIPSPNDFVMKSIGPQPVLMTRDRHGTVHLLLNRCPHRGNQVCLKERGNAGSFTCQYHGWTFNNSGSLRGFPFPSGYEGVDRSQLGLGRVPRVATYQGFVFGSFAIEGPSLEQYLGGARDSIDRLVRTSPEGEVEITAGFLKHKVRSNWKFLVENETDGYHPQFVHASIFSVAKSGIGSLYGDQSTAVSRDLGDGHTENDLRPEFRRLGVPMGWFGTTADRLPDYTAKMKAAYGEEQARAIMVDGVPHTMIFPNLFIAEIQLFVIQPLAVDETVQHVTALQFKGAPDLNRRLRQQTMGSVGPAGFLLADDAEMYERTQRGVQSRDPEWLYLGRGKHRERRDADGFLVGDATDEVPSRGIWRHYRALMESGVMAADLQREVEQFLYREARLADAHEYAAWEALWTDDGVYWIPANGDDGDPEAVMSILYDNRSRIALRVKQLLTGRRHSQIPRSNLRRLVSNVEILGDATGEGDLPVACTTFVYESSVRGETVWASRNEFRLRRTADGLRMAFKKVMLANNDKALFSMSFLV